MDSDEIRFGKYMLTDRIGAGGMAEVFLAKVSGPEGVEKQVVIKRIHPDISRDTEFVNMFIDEARISVLLRHGNIVPVFDFGKTEGSYYLAMEYVDGVNLARILKACRESQRALPVELAVFIAAEVCKGLHHAHRLKDPSGRALQIVHRDISPQNAMISFEGEVKLLDFGIARAAGRISRTGVGVLKGKLLYMSPEQVKGLSVDARSDLFSVGSILYEMLTGVCLFDADNPDDVLEKIISSVVVPPSRHNRDIPKSIDKIVLRALAREPRDRYRSAEELGSELSREIYLLAPAFLPHSLASFTREICGIQEAELEPQSGFEQELVRQLGGAKAGHPAALPKVQLRDAAASHTLQLRKGGPLAGEVETEKSTAPKDVRPKRYVSWILLGVVFGLVATISVAGVIWFGEPEAVPPPEKATVLPPVKTGKATDRTPAVKEGEQAATVLLTELSLEDQGSHKPRKPAIRKRRRKRNSKKQEPAEAPLVGKVQINAEPWANVYWRGKNLGHTPLFGLELPVGKHVLRLVNPEFGVEKELRIEVKVDRQTKAVVRMLE